MEVAKPASDPGRGQPLGWGGSLPGAAEIVGEAAGQPQLGVGGDDQPGPAVPGGGVTDLGYGPAEGLFEQAEGVFQVEAAQERLPAAIDVGRGGVGLRPPQPQRFRVLLSGQVLDLQPDQGALDDREIAGVVGPGAAVFQPRVQPVPGLGVSTCRSGWCRWWSPPAVAARPAAWARANAAP